jgi:hypothetical protein
VQQADSAEWSIQQCDVQMQERDPAVINSGIKQSVRHFHMLGVIAPFAAASSGANTFLLLTKAMAKFLKVSITASEPVTIHDLCLFCGSMIVSDQLHVLLSLSGFAELNYDICLRRSTCCFCSCACCSRGSLPSTGRGSRGSLFARCSLSQS